MKKLIMAVAIVCAAVASQAAQITWNNSSSAKIYGLDGATAISSANAKNWSLVISLLDSEGNVVARGSNPSMTAGVMQGSTYTYTYGTDFSNGDMFTILATMTVDGKDYEMKFGSFTIAATDNTGKDTFTWASGTYGGLSGTATAGSQAAWVTKDPEPGSGPEPTSGLLLLLGMAGLALRRRRA